uniref:cellulose synthase-like protein H1 isoform X2 n=1 Tax=Erigeron canadensis TaxID=72917 RepID=UPI001CB89F94|nr:cellulose synthase-like protein H1 isoform X2 [Erigeron canadensis]
MLKNTTQDPTGLPLQEKVVHKNTTARAIELAILSLLVSLLVYRVISFKDQHHYLPWLLAFFCESCFTVIWVLSVSTKWNQSATITYPERLSKRVKESEFPAVDIFVTTADPILEPAIITMNTVLSLLAVDFPANKLALYLSDDGCSPITFYSLVETTKFAELWVPFCKKYNVQVRAPFRYFTHDSTPLENDSLEFQKEWKKMKNEYGDLCTKIENASKRTSFPCDQNSEFAAFRDVHRSNHPAIIKVISENKEGSSNNLPHIIYISREKNPKHQHYYKAGAMNVLTRVSGVMTNAPLMLNVDCDMYANNPQLFLHAMCMVFGFNNDEYGFFQFPQAFYDGLKDDPFGNQLANYYYFINGVASLQGIFYGGSNCFHRRMVMYGSSPNRNMDNESLHKSFGKSIELRESAVQVLSGSNTTIQRRRSPTSLIEVAILVASSTYEYGTSWGTKIGWLYGSTAEDILTGLNIHGRGWRSAMTSPEPLAFLGCAPSTYTSSLVQQRRWSTGLSEVLFSTKNPLYLTIKGHLWFRQSLAYCWICSWGVRSIPELCYAALPAYCLITNSHFLPKINEPSIIIPVSIFIIYNLYTLWELKRLGISLRTWWNLQKMGRVNAMTAWFSGLLSVILKLSRFSQTVFEVTSKEQILNDGDHDSNAGRFTYENSPMIIPGVFLLLVNMTALVNTMSKLAKANTTGVSGLGEMFCSVWLIICFWEFLKGLFGNGKYGIPSSIIWKAGALALFFVQLCRRSFQLI